MKGDNLRLDIVEHPVRGYEPDGCSYNGPYQDVRQLKDVFVRGNGARSTGQRDFGPESKFSTTVFAIDLTSFLTDPGSKSRKTFKARIIFAELPGTESLAGDVASLAQRQGANLNKSLLQIKHVARVLSNPKTDQADYVEFESSKATHILADALGGNSSTCVIGFCRQGQTKDSTETLEMVDLFLRARTYPLHNADIEQDFQGKCECALQKKRHKLKC